MQVTVRLFARARELAETGEVELSLQPGATLGEVVKTLQRDFPALDPFLGHCRLAVNCEFADLDCEVPAGAEVALIPPVSGGR